MFSGNDVVSSMVPDTSSNCCDTRASLLIELLDKGALPLKNDVIAFIGLLIAEILGSLFDEPHSISENSGSAVLLSFLPRALRTPFESSSNLTIKIQMTFMEL